MRVVIGGGSGFIGQALSERLKKSGHEVILISRSGALSWEDLEKKGLPKCDAVINLAGAGVLAKKWTPEYKRELYASRLDTTRQIVRAISEADEPPEVFINASATGYYLQDMATEESRAGSDFLSTLCQQWEAAAKLPENCTTRGVIIRIGLAMGRDGGAFKKMLPAFKWGLGGPIGSGDQGFPWIHIDDLVGLFLFAIEQPVKGVINGVAPEVVTNREFSKCLGKVLHRPAFCKAPAPFLKFVLGERAQILLKGVRVVPVRAVALGYEFAYPTLKDALTNLVRKSA